jgi:hypothetical protein
MDGETERATPSESTAGFAVKSGRLGARTIAEASVVSAPAAGEAAGGGAAGEGGEPAFWAAARDAEAARARNSLCAFFKVAIPAET